MSEHELLRECRELIQILHDKGSAVGFGSGQLLARIDRHLAQPEAHTDHPLRHWDRSCPACIADQPEVAKCPFCELPDFAGTDCKRVEGCPRAGRVQPEAAPVALGHLRACAAWTPLETCDCCLKERIALQTEQTMHAAWRKRAEEAETKLASPPSAPDRALVEELRPYFTSENDVPVEHATIPAELGQRIIAALESKP